MGFYCIEGEIGVSSNLSKIVIKEDLCYN